VTTPSTPETTRPGPRAARAAGLAGLAGILAAALALGVAELVAVFVRPEAAPVVAVGGAVIDATPEPLKRFAIQRFGSNDKQVLLAGIGVAVALLAGATGVVASRRLRLGVACLAGFGMVGAAAALGRPGGGPLDALPTALGVAAGAAALVALARTVPGRAGARPAGARSADSQLAGTRPADSQPADARPTVPTGRTDRRRFLLTGLGVLGLAATAGAAGAALRSVRLSAAGSRAAVRLPAAADPAPPLPAGADLDVPGLTPFTTPAGDFYRVDTALVVPQVPTDGWTLKISGRVDRELELSYDDLLARPLVERDITLACVSNEIGGPYSGNARWLGVPLAPLLREAGVRPEADQILSRGADGMTISTPTAAVLDGRDAMLAVGMNGRPLPLRHGFPVRMVVPGLFGYTSATKWLTGLELTRFADAEAYWTKRGWADRAPVKTFSRIDTPRPLAPLRPGRVPVAGVAYAQHRGIERVEVRIDNGPWRPATLAPVPSTDTWRQWVYHWDATPGRHLIEVRATDATGAIQPENRVPPFPDGATGWHSAVVNVG
jgi:DMSO/TMAO reductase YedYZ molybdopterin-dependent catalytic subunit